MILILNSANVIKIYTCSVIALSCANNAELYEQRTIERHQFTKALLKLDAIRAHFDSEDKHEIQYFMMKIMLMIRSSDLGLRALKIKVTAGASNVCDNIQHRHQNLVLLCFAGV